MEMTGFGGAAGQGAYERVSLSDAPDRALSHEMSQDGAGREDESAKVAQLCEMGFAEPAARRALAAAGGDVSVAVGNLEGQ
mmetsp:Transcript_855/g.2206  ORF Transcript_855/g.2206 Transcript_855/m.2206 type:complete len:81 (+) Transcript_855:2-244(+)